MKEKGLYYTNTDFQAMIRSVGGEWNDVKHRPIVCLIKSTEDSELYWAIPMGKYNHRSKEQIDKIEKFINYPEKDIRSCFYHIGRTSTKSIFFISDAIPITDKYIAEEHVGGDNKHYIIKNTKLLSELERKLYRILSMENGKKNHFRQHISDVKRYLLNELKEKREKMKEEIKNIYDAKVLEINKEADEKLSVYNEEIDKFEKEIIRIKQLIEEVNVKRNQDLSFAFTEFQENINKIDIT